MNLFELEKDRFEWAKTTFPNYTPLTALQKCRKEIEEIENDIHAGCANPAEYADAIMCLLDSAGRVGISFEQIAKAFANKNEINKNRKWELLPDGTYQHV